jgi:hypothetical protein
VEGLFECTSEEGWGGFIEFVEELRLFLDDVGHELYTDE